MADINIIKDTIQELPYIHLVGELSQDDNGNITGTFNIDTKEGLPQLEWRVRIESVYPYKVNGHESIHFFNDTLIDYPHIMEGNFLCLHSSFYPNERLQLLSDLSQVKEWVSKYFVNGQRDERYEHLVVNNEPINKAYYSFLFTNVNYNFPSGDYGRVTFFNLYTEKSKEMYPIYNYGVFSFKSDNTVHSKEHKCLWESNVYQKHPYHGIYCKLEQQPAIHGKFIIKDYCQLNNLLDSPQLKYIYTAIRNAGYMNQTYSGYLPLMLGYNIPSGELHWQTIMLPVDELPMKGEKIKVVGTKINYWVSKFINGHILWASTVNCDYKYYFGRGAYPKSITSKNILLLGVGAIGSMVATTLVRCGARKITLADFDDKQPENICRSEYAFMTGVGPKIHEMLNILSTISPYVECRPNHDLDMIIKYAVTNKKKIKDVQSILNEFDYIFDCTTDNSLMFCLEELNIKARIINISITNHAKELVCAFSPNIRNYVETMYTKILNNDTIDLFYPTGCWNPTFKASYNDIATMVQFSMKHIVKMLTGEENITNFYVSEDSNSLIINRL